VKVELNPAITEIVVFMSDSVSDCATWLSKDYRIRKFFEPSDTLGDFVSEYFTHDEILEFYESVETTTLLDLKPYLSKLNISSISTIDSLNGCASSINAIAFLDNHTKAMVLFTHIETEDVFTSNFMLSKTSGMWQIADTLRQESHPRKR
jgi:hypothetical protein